MLILLIIKFIFACGDASATRGRADEFGVIRGFNPVDLAFSGVSPDSSILSLGICLAQESESKFLRDNSQRILDSLENEMRLASIQIEAEKRMFPNFPRKIDSIVDFRALLLRTLSSTKQANSMWKIAKYLLALSVLSAAGIFLYRINRQQVGDA